MKYVLISTSGFPKVTINYRR